MATLSLVCVLIAAGVRAALAQEHHNHAHPKYSSSRSSRSSTSATTSDTTESSSTMFSRLSTSVSTSDITEAWSSSSAIPSYASTSSAIPSYVVPSSASSSSAIPTSAIPSYAVPSSAIPSNVQYAGVNIAGFSFGCVIDGTCDTSQVVDAAPIGLTHMTHFVNNDNLNAFRLPVGWQYLTDSTLGGTLTHDDTYGQLVANCLATNAALCIIDVHNYARWDNNLIGSAAVPTRHFLDLWAQIAAKWGSDSRIAFSIMNEPHDLPDVTAWAEILNSTVATIRQNGGADNMILLAGSHFASVKHFLTDGTAQALNTVVNPDGTTANLVFDIHAYTDSDGSGKHAACTVDVTGYFSDVATWLRANGRQAMVTETGGGPTEAGCLDLVCRELWTLRDNADVYLGWLGWGAGAFSSSYIITETPRGYTDVELVQQCIAGVFNS